MKERPILFSGPMVRAILEGRKTMTRRVVKPNSGPHTIEQVIGTPDSLAAFVRNCCPYGVPGDRLWVRENWRIGAWDVESTNSPALAIDYFDGPRKEWIKDPRDLDGSKTCRYVRRSIDELFKKKIRPDAANKWKWTPGESPLRWRPSIHMPRWASRITLEVTRVGVERLQAISDEDAQREGVECLEWMGHGGTWRDYTDLYAQKFSARTSFFSLWVKLNGRGAVDNNPWVWVVEFGRVM